MENTQLNDTRLSPHFRLGEFCNLGKYPDNKPTMNHGTSICLTGQTPSEYKPRL